MRKRCRSCNEPSLPGLKINPGLCQYHYTERMWGTAWAKLVADADRKQRELRALEEST